MALSRCRKEEFALPDKDRWPSRTLGEPTPCLSREYPSEWFAAHPGSKPVALVKRCFASEDHLARAVSAGLAAGRLPVEYVVQFMHVEGAKITCTLEEDWKSFGVTIGCAGETISPWDLLNITEQVGPENLVNSDVTAAASDGSSPDRDGLFALVACIYRLLVTNCRGERRDYRQRLLDKQLKRMLGMFRTSGRCLDGAEKNFEHWVKDRSFLSLIAALDMFLNRFSCHRMSILRAGTMVSRYKHCTVIDDIKSASKFASMGPFEFAQWVFVERAAAEVVAILREGEELFASRSYAPYLSDLGLCQRSPYSATANPLMHFFCKATAALRGHSESKNSKIACDGDLIGVTLNAMVFAYAKENINTFRMGVFTSMEELRECELLEAAKTNVPRGYGEMPKVFEAAEWYQYLSEKSFVIDPKISRNLLIYLRPLGSSDMREGTVGAKLLELIAK